MPIGGKIQQLWLQKSGYSNPNDKLKGLSKETYKPRALRIPVLLCLFFLFLISFTALELLLDRTVKPSEFYKSHGLKAPQKRQLPAAQCPSPEENSKILASLRQQQAALCTTYTTTFKPSTTDLSPPMQTSFDSWLAVYSAMEAQLEFAESCATTDSVASSLSSLLATASTTGLTLPRSSTSVVDRLQDTSSALLTSTTDISRQITSQPASTSPTAIVGTLSLSSPSLTSTISNDVINISGSILISSSVTPGLITITTTNSAISTSDASTSFLASQSFANLPISSPISGSSSPSSPSSINQSPGSVSFSSTQPMSSANSSVSPLPATSPSISSTSIISSYDPSIISTTTDTTDASSSTTSPSASPTPSFCTELNAPCSDCAYEYCYCNLSNGDSRKRGALYRSDQFSGAYEKRQSTFFCRVDTCHCPWSGEILDYVCGPVNTCSQNTSSTALDASSSNTQLSSTQSPPTTSIVISSTLNLTSTTARELQILIITTLNTSSITTSIVSESSTSIASSNSSTVVTTTTSSTQVVCTDTSGPCFECGQDYCICTQDGGCEVDECHCSLSESEWTCNEESTCQQSAICEHEGDTCHSCDAQFCKCSAPFSNKRQTGLICTVDTCYCQWNSTAQNYDCDAYNGCECPSGSDGQSCSGCEGSNCMCQSGQCVLETCTPEREGLSCSCEGEHCSCFNQTCAYTCFDAPDGDYCDTCSSGECECSEQTCVSTTPVVSNSSESFSSSSSSSSSSTPLSSLSTASTSTATTSASLTKEHLPGATCPPSSPTCYNCVTERCACEADGWCYPDECWCDQVAQGQWTCGTINRCDPNACDTSVLQCHGCNSGNSTALCTCAYDGVCSAVTCAACAFNESGTELNCPDSCYTKRDISFNESSIPFSRDVRRMDTRYNRKWGMMDRRQGVEVLTGGFQTPLRDAWNYLLWTEPLTVRRTSSSLVSTATLATFTLDVFDNPRSTSWPSLSSTPPLAYRPTVPACIPATLIAPAPFETTIVKRDIDIRTVKPYVTRESTTVVVRIRDNYLQMTSNIPTITRGVPPSTQISIEKSVYNGYPTVAPPEQSGDLSIPYSVRSTSGSLLYQMETFTVAIESTGAFGKVDTQTVVVVQPSIVIAGNGPPETDGTGNSNGGGRSALTGLSDNKRVVQVPFTQPMYFAALYLPALMAVAIKIMYETIVASIKMMEPFERLHRQEGSSAEDSLSSEYLSSSLSFDVIRSIWSGRSIPLWTLIIYMLITISAPLASAAMTVRPMDMCLIGGTELPCMPTWIVDLNEIRILEAFLAICMALTLVLAWDSWNYHAGVPSNPTSIAAMAVLLNYEPLRSDLQLIKPDATDREMSKALEQYHFWLLPHYPTRVQSRYGIIHSPMDSAQTSTWMTRLERVRKIFFLEWWGLDTLHLVTTLTLLALLTTYRANLRNDAFNYFFASSGFWPKFILVGLATVIDMQWKNLEREVRIAEPYRRLYKGNARPENTILWPMNGTCWSNLPRCVKVLFEYDGMWFETLVGFTAILSDVNIIAVAGVLMSSSQTKAAYEWSSVTALICTGFMFCVLLLSMIWWRRSVSMLPRKPETIAAVLSYLCISRMAIDFANMKMEKMGAHERDEMIIGLGRRYRFGLMMGEDGQERYCIDYDDDICDDGTSERDRWLQEKVAAPAAVRLSI